jgi:hypothetical protein
MITISLLVLVGCDNYEFVNTDEYLVVKKEETKIYYLETTWKGLNILSEVKTKYTDGKVYYIIDVSDIDGVPILETDYYETLNQGYLEIIFRDKDNFELHEESIKVTNFSIGVDDNNIETTIVKQGSFDLEESEYIKIGKVRIGTQGI